MAWRSALLVLALLAADAGATQRPIDTAHSQLGFEIRTRLGQLLKGRFPVFSGYTETLPDGSQQVSLVVDAAQAEIPGHPRYTRWLRGEDFFDAGRYPQILFRSRPHAPELVLEGGPVEGVLTLRGVPGLVEMAVEPAGCRRAGYDCPVSGRGTVSRAAYGMDSWQFAVSDRVTFVLQVRLAGADPS